MLIKDLRKAIKDGELVDITGVKLRSWGTDNQLPAVLHINFDVPSVENKTINDILDVTEISLSTKPKYDPNRKFRKGDKVRIVEWNGRKSMRDGMIALVVNNEDNGGMVEVSIDGWKNGVFYNACKLELVTPVEELEPYTVVESYGRTDVMKGDYPIATYTDSHPHAKEAAEAERDRLNAEWRKKMGK